MIRYIARKIAHYLIEYCKKRDKVFVITGTDYNGQKTPYLVRYLVVSTKLFSFYIHRFLRSDHDAPHDHPWNFFTYIIDGSYCERCYDPIILPIGSVLFRPRARYRKAGSLAFKRATDVHKVELYRHYDMSEIEKAPLTMCFIGYRQREWGFWKRMTYFPQKYYRGKWVLWTEFLGIEPDQDKRG